MRQHALDSMFENALWELLQHQACGRERRATLISRMTEVGLVDELLPCELYFFCIDDDDIITGIYMRSKCRFIFTAKNFSNLGCETADRLDFCVYNIPFTSSTVGLASLS